VWRGERSDAPQSRTLTHPHLRGVALRAEVLQPTTASATVEWGAVEGWLTVGLPRTDTAVDVGLSAAV
jgi:alpha-galactosidase